MDLDATARRRDALLEAERAILGAALLDATILDEVGGLAPSDFFGHAEATTYRAMVEMRRAGQAVDYSTLGLELEKRGELAAVGGASWISGLTDYCASLASVRTYAGQVRDAARARGLRSALAAALRSLDDGTPAMDVAAGVAAALGGGLFADCNVYSMREVLSDTMELIEKCQVGTGQVATGVPEMDKGGLTPMPGEYVIVGARPNVGKTMLALHVARAMALRGEGVLVVSLEMTRALLGVRHLSNHTGVAGDAMLAFRGLGEGQLERITAAAAELYQIPIWTYLNRDLGCVVATAKRMAATKQIRAVFVDYLGLLEIPDQERRELEIAQASAQLSGLAHDTGIVVYSLSQLNRSVESREDRHPRLSDLRESGSIEQDADRVWLLYRPGIGTANDQVIEVCQAKSRNGPAGQVVTVPYRGGRIVEDHDDPRDNWRVGSYAEHTAGRD